MKLRCSGIVNHFFFYVGAIVDSKYRLHYVCVSSLFLNYCNVCFYRDMGFVTLNVLLYIVKIQGLGVFLFRIVNHRDGDIVKYVFNSALVHIFL